MKAKSKWLYIHTINGLPGYFVEGQQVCYADGEILNAADSLQQIRKEQKFTRKWRRAQGFDADTQAEYGYIKILRKLLK